MVNLITNRHIGTYIRHKRTKLMFLMRLLINIYYNSLELGTQFLYLNC